mmetsp:Transcript_87445/g.283118  ORF Transcript_87445/g.283118 Transcript_87445/m.283118 type:complete len:217 (+) Transcript_87445:221-871(+)
MPVVPRALVAVQLVVVGHGLRPAPGLQLRADRAVLRQRLCCPDAVAQVGVLLQARKEELEEVGFDALGAAVPAAAGRWITLDQIQVLMREPILVDVVAVCVPVAAEERRVLQGGLRGHHTVCARCLQASVNVVQSGNATVGDHRNGQCLLDCGNGTPVALARGLLVLEAAAAVHRQHGATSLLQPVAEPQGAWQVVAEEPNLACHGHHEPGAQGPH